MFLPLGKHYIKHDYVDVCMSLAFVFYFFGIISEVAKDDDDDSELQSKRSAVSEMDKNAGIL